LVSDDFDRMFKKGKSVIGGTNYRSRPKSGRKGGENSKEATKSSV